MHARRILLVLTASALAATGLLPAGPAASAEDQVVLEGRLVVAHEDDLTHGVARHSVRLVAADGRHTLLRVADEGAAHGLSGAQVRVRGERRGGSVEVAEMGATDGRAASEVTGAAAGGMDLAVVLFSFADKPLAVTAPEVDGLVFTRPEAPAVEPTVQDWLAANSFGRLPVSGQVLGPVPITARSTDPCDYVAWGQEARAALGLDEAAYTHVTHVMPPSTCAFNGVAYLPGTQSWVNTPALTSQELRWRFRGVVEHEIGHNLGAHHGGSLSCTEKGVRVTLSNRCTLSEYGDPFTAMGAAWAERHVNAHQKLNVSAYAPGVGRVPWLDGAEDTQLVSAPGTATVILAPLESDGAGVEVLRVRRSNSEYYYVEYRDGTGLDSGDRTWTETYRGEPYNPAPQGVTVRIATAPDVRSVSKLLDMSPGTPAFADAALSPGQVFRDGTGVSIKLVEGSTVEVTIAPTKGRR